MKRGGVTGALIPAGLFIGMGIGLIVDQVAGWMMIGLGAGFALMVLIELIGRPGGRRPPDA